MNFTVNIGIMFIVLVISFGMGLYAAFFEGDFNALFIAGFGILYAGYLYYRDKRRACL